MRYLMLPCSILIFTVAVSQEANIFAIFTYPGKSHVAMGERLLKRLAEKGHNVDIATHFPSEEVPAR
jgi:glucuronosyltransferase